MLRPVCFVVASFAIVTASHADVYKFVDNKGQVQYTDRPDTLPAQRLSVQTQRTDTVAVSERVAEEAKQRDAANQAQQAADKNAADKSKAQQNTTADKADRCTKARERYDQVMTAQRLYTTDDKGERVYMDDKQIDQTRASAKQMMDTWCN